MNIDTLTMLANLSLTFLNLLILALNLKLYTEYFKDKSMSKRAEKNN